MTKTTIFKALACAALISLSASAGAVGSVRIAAHRGFWDCDAAKRTENSIRKQAGLT